MPARTWRRNNVALIASPNSAMKLLKAIEVFDELEKIVIERRWTFATQVLVMDSELGIFGELECSVQELGFNDSGARRGQ